MYYYETLRNFLLSAIGKEKIMYWPIGQVGRVFANASGDWGSIPGQIIPKTQKKWYLIPLCLTQDFKVWIKGKVEQFREKSSTFHYSSV